jgi:regulator of PEP synthase PpsR (kinase-PPPase family)
MKKSMKTKTNSKPLENQHEPEIASPPTLAPSESHSTRGATPTTDRRILLVSDGTGETCALTVRAAMVQFSDHSVEFIRHKNIRTEAQIEAIIDFAAKKKDLIIFTLVSPQLRDFLITKAKSNKIPIIDIMGPLLAGLGQYFGYEPKAVAGLLHDVNEKYFKRIEAMEYTIAHDDGKDLSDLDKADLVILGISRTSKTPLSMYLSHQGWRVANIPLIVGFDLPEQIYELDQRKIIGLTIDPIELATIRRNRLKRLGQDHGGDYADIEKVNEEIQYANEIFKKNRRWPVFNVTGKALEETAAEIIRLMSARRLIPPSGLEALGMPK